MNTNKVQIIIGVVAVVAIGMAVAGSLRQKSSNAEFVPAADISASTSTEKSVSANIQVDNVVMTTDGAISEIKKAAGISGIAIQNMSPANIIVSWTTSAPVITEIYYSAAPPVPNVARQMLRDAKPKTTHAVELTNLVPDTTYYYTILSVNTKEGLATSTVSGLFKTLQK